jgi:hypothetical protein
LGSAQLNTPLSSASKAIPSFASWYNRHLHFRQEVQEGRETCDPKIMAGAIKSAKKVEQKYGRKSLGPYSEFDWGMMNGKLSALRWIFGEDWETTLDT